MKHLFLFASLTPKPKPQAVALAMHVQTLMKERSMCLGIPGRIIEIKGQKARVDVAGVKKDISTRLLDGLRVGDYVIVHAGFAIEHLDEEKARETISMIEEVIGWGRAR